VDVPPGGTRAPEELPKRGTRIGSYEVLGPLGAGGMGLVIRAKDLRLGREVAIKLLYADAVADEKRLRRFVAEAKAASALNHPNILMVFELEESPRGPYIVTELVDGATVRSLLGIAPFPLSMALDVATQTLAGLAEAHGVGLVHRDIKPENLMIRRDGYVKILDFGLAKLAPRSAEDDARRVSSLGVSSTKDGLLVGTAAYMSPEHVRGEAVTRASDLFAVSVVLYEMVTGRNPFQRDSNAGTVTAILRDVPPPIPGAPDELAAILARGLERDPARRFESAREMEERLRQLRARLQPASEGGPPELAAFRLRTADRFGGRIWKELTRPFSPTRRRAPIAASLGLLVAAAAALLLLLRTC
jgi:serine/threonine protein kinase